MSIHNPDDIIVPGDGNQPARFDFGAFHGYDLPMATRFDGWTVDRQLTFLEALADGHNVRHACRIVGLTPQTAYTLRASARGSQFRLAWDAAVLKARDRLSDQLYEWAMDGVTSKTEHPDGSVTTRHRFEPHFAMKVLNRLDKQAEAAANSAARLIAQDWEQYLELLRQNSGPARAGLFLAARTGDAGIRPANAEELEPIRSLARADKWLRTRTDLADAPETSDLDPANRAEWTAEQWRRAEEAGLYRLAPEPAPATPQSDQDDQLLNGDPRQGERVWWDSVADKWQTNFPPPEGFYGLEECEYGDEDYARDLTVDEEEVVEAPHREEIEARRKQEEIARDAWFGFKGDGDAEEEVAEAASEALPLDGGGLGGGERASDDVVEIDVSTTPHRHPGAGRDPESQATQPASLPPQQASDEPNHRHPRESEDDEEGGTPLD